MFDVTGYSFCVLNGTKLAKEKAKYILPYTNEEDIIDKIVCKYIYMFTDGKQMVKNVYFHKQWIEILYEKAYFSKGINL